MSKDDSTTASPARDAIKAFRQAASEIFAQWAMLGSIGTSGLRDSLSYIGLDYYEVASTDAANVITVTVPDTDMSSIVPSGKVEDYTDEALSRFASEHLSKLRKTVHRKIRDRQIANYITPDLAVSGLKSLGYADSALPAIVS